MNIGNPIPSVVQRWFFRLWRPALAIGSLALVAWLLYFHRLGTLLPGYSTTERATMLASSNWHYIANNPVNAPYKILVWLFTAVAHHGALMTRAVSACFGILAVAAFFIIIRPWYGFRIAFLGTLLFATSAGLLHTARLGTPLILQMSLLAVLFTAGWYRRSHHRAFVGYVVLGVSAILWYVPGMLWFELIGVALVWRSLWGQLHRTKPLHIAGSLATFVVILAPLIVASIHDPHVALSAAGLPQHLGTLKHFGMNLLHNALGIGIYSNSSQLLTVGHVPLLGVAERVLAALGLYAYLRHNRSVRTWFIAGTAVISLLLMSLGGSVGFAMLLPLLYLLVVHGLDHFLGRWLTVFPRNPIARSVGVGVVCAMLFFSVLYQVRVYFVAWPHNPTTQAAFRLPPS
jgi:hypothetical protein